MPSPCCLLLSVDGGTLTAVFQIVVCCQPLQDQTGIFGVELCAAAPRGALVFALAFASSRTGRLAGVWLA